MKVFINEKSFCGEANTEDEAFSILYEVITIAAELKKQSNNGEIFRHRDLKRRDILRNTSIEQFLIDLLRTCDPKKKGMVSTFLTMFAKAPFIQDRHGDHDTLVDEDTECQKSTCFDDASGSCCGAAVISSSLSKKYNTPHINLHSSIFGRCRIVNFQHAHAAASNTWIYEVNIKHEIPKDKIVNGVVHSAMDLPPGDAQRVLTNGILVGKSVYNYFSGRLYKFHRHKDNIFHGFPIDRHPDTEDLSFAKRFIDRHKDVNHGQVEKEFLHEKPQRA